MAQKVFPLGDESGIPLLAPGVVITDALKQRLARTNVRSVMIDDEYSRGITAESAVTEETRRETIISMRGAFDSVSRSGGESGALTPQHVQKVNSAMAAIMAELSWRKNLMTGLSDLNRFGGDKLNRAVNVCVVGITIGRRYLEHWGWRDYKDQLRRDQFNERVQKLGMGLILSDIGMLMVPQHLWGKDLGQLDEEDQQLLAEHPGNGVELLRDTGVDISALTTVTILQHHERADGSGYPRGLVDEEQHDHGLIAAVADAYVSMTEAGQVDDNGNGRAPRPAMPPHEAYQKIIDGKGTLYDAKVIEAFCDTVAPYSPGATVRLSDGRYAIVADHSEVASRPHVRATHGADGKALMLPEQIDLSEAPDDLTIVEATAGLPTDSGW